MGSPRDTAELFLPQGSPRMRGQALLLFAPPSLLDLRRGAASHLDRDTFACGFLALLDRCARLRPEARVFCGLGQGLLSRIEGVCVWGFVLA